MQHASDETKSGWLTKLGGNALRKTWKRRWFELKGNFLYYYRQPSDKKPSGVINLSTYNSVSRDTTATKKSLNCIRIEKVIRESDLNCGGKSNHHHSGNTTSSSSHSSTSSSPSTTSSGSLMMLKKPSTILAFADTELEMQEWINVLEKNLGGRNIVDIVLDRLELTGMHHRQASYGSLNSFYSRNSSSFCSSGGSNSGSTLSSRRPSWDSLSLDTPSLNSRKSSIDSINHSNPQSSYSSYSSHSSFNSDNPANLVAMFGLGQPILRKPASSSALLDRKSNLSYSDNGENNNSDNDSNNNDDDNNDNSNGNNRVHGRHLSLNITKDRLTVTNSTPLIMVHKLATSPDELHFPHENNEIIGKNDNVIISNRNINSVFNHHTFHALSRKRDSKMTTPITPLANVFPSHLA